MGKFGRIVRLRWAVLPLAPLLLLCCASSGPELSGSASTLSGATLSAAAPSAPPIAHAAPAYRVEDVLPWIESRAFLQANIARRRSGLPDLEMRMDLMDAARGHAVDMARRGYFSHHGPEGAGPGDRAASRGIRFYAYAENLARVKYSGDPAGMAVLGWLGSPGHRRNLLDEGGAGYRYTGIGVARGADGAVYLAQVFLR